MGSQGVLGLTQSGNGGTVVWKNVHQWDTITNLWIEPLVNIVDTDESLVQTGKDTVSESIPG